MQTSPAARLNIAFEVARSGIRQNSLALLDELLSCTKGPLAKSSASTLDYRAALVLRDHFDLVG